MLEECIHKYGSIQIERARDRSGATNREVRSVIKKKQGKRRRLKFTSLSCFFFDLC